jgi:hypothetical protein
LLRPPVLLPVLPQTLPPAPACLRAAVMEMAGGGSLTSYVADKWQKAQALGLFLSEDEARYFFKVGGGWVGGWVGVPLGLVLLLGIVLRGWTLLLGALAGASRAAAAPPTYLPSPPSPCSVWLHPPHPTTPACSNS